MISNARISGDQISFMFRHERYSGVVNDDKMEGSIVSGKKIRKWYAERLDN